MPPRPRLVYYLDPVAYGGAVRYVERLIVNLDPQEFDVHVICPEGEEMAPFFRALAGRPVTVHPLAPTAHFKSAVYEASRSAGGARGAMVRVLRWPGVRAAAKTALALAALARDSRESRRVAQVVAAARPDILHVNCDHFPDNTGRLALLAGHRAGARRVVATIHQPPEPPVFPRRLSHLHDRRALRAADTVIVLARRFIPLFREWYGAPGEVMTLIYNGSPESCFEERPSRLHRRDVGVSGAAVLVAHVGSVMPARGQIVLAEALVSLLDVCPALEAVLVGRNMDEAYLSSVQDRLQREGRGRLRWIGYREDAVEVMRLGDIAVVSSFQEAHPFALIEAMAVGRAVVATDVGANAETIEDGVSGILVPAGDAKRLAEAIRRLYESPALRERMGLAARAAARERFTERRMVRETLSHYRAPGEPA